MEEKTRVIIGVYDDVHVERDGDLKLAHKKIRVERVLELPASTGRYAHVGKSRPRRRKCLSGEKAPDAGAFSPKRHEHRPARAIRIFWTTASRLRRRRR
jgi:hypothetical protein